MNITKIDEMISTIVKESFSPTELERKNISKEYDKLSTYLPGKTFQTGSYARYTAITPVNDLDVMYEVNNRATMSDMIEQLYDLLKGFYNESLLDKQDHSIKIIVPGQPFTVDVIPAIKIDESNESGDTLYLISELDIKEKWRKYYKVENGFIKTDPKGYISDATKIDSESISNGKFRKVVKFLKKWKHVNKVSDEQFKLKSFHIEQMIFGIFKQNPNVGIFESINIFLSNLEGALNAPSILDRAYKRSEEKRFIDEYVSDLTKEQKDAIILGKNNLLNLLQKIERMDNETDAKANLKYILGIKDDVSYANRVVVKPISKPYGFGY